MAQSSIEWTESTWNPVTGCKVSPGCINCYAETMARRLQGMGQPDYERTWDEMPLDPLAHTSGGQAQLL